MATTERIAVALLARAGVARDRLATALRDAGVRIALEADPSEADDASVAASGARALVIALEPAGEDVLDRYDHSLGDPGMTVLIEEAELVARREGWDAARWSRHVAAKLGGHDRVLPPGGEADDAPGPGAATRRAAAAGDAADDGGALCFEGASFGGARGQDAAAGEMTFEAIPADDVEDDGDAPAGQGGIALDGLVSAEDMDWSSGSEHALDGIDIAAQFPDFAPLEADASGLEPAPRRPELPEDALDAGDSPGGARFDIPSTTGSTPAPERTSELSLVDHDADLALSTVDAVPARDRQHDLQALQTSASRLSLVELDDGSDPSPGAVQGDARGVVVVEGGMGGPDAVRQFLAAIPKAFPRALLIRLKLESGRYDSLVKQMQRASKRSVALATPGQAVDPGTVYFLPPDLRIVQGPDARAQFAAASSEAEPYAALVADDTAIVFISGADPALVEPAMALAAQGALVGAQSPDTCYDAAACQDVIARGGICATPAELAARLIQRWPA